MCRALACGQAVFNDVLDGLAVDRRCRWKKPGFQFIPDDRELIFHKVDAIAVFAVPRVVSLVLFALFSRAAWGTAGPIEMVFITVGVARVARTRRRIRAAFGTVWILAATLTRLRAVRCTRTIGFCAAWTVGTRVTIGIRSAAFAGWGRIVAVWVCPAMGTIWTVVAVRIRSTAITRRRRVAVRP